MKGHKVRKKWTGTELLLNTRAPKGQGKPNKSSSKEQLGADHHYPHPGSSHFPFRGTKEEIQELSPRVIFVHFKFPTKQSLEPGLPLSPPHNLQALHSMFKMVPVCREAKGSISFCRRSVPTYSLVSPCTSMVPGHCGLGVIALSTPFRFFKQLCKKEVTCHHNY